MTATAAATAAIPIRHVHTIAKELHLSPAQVTATAAALYHHAQVHKSDRNIYLTSLRTAAAVAPTSPAGQSATTELAHQK